MLGDPHQCRLHSERCLALAKRSKKAKDRETFLTMAETWRKLAAEIESHGALLRTISEMELGEPSESRSMKKGYHHAPEERFFPQDG